MLLPNDAGLERTRYIVPNEDALLKDVALLAKRMGMVVVYRGSRIVICSEVPLGWSKLPIKSKSQLPASSVPVMDAQFRVQ